MEDNENLTFEIFLFLGGGIIIFSGFILGIADMEILRNVIIFIIPIIIGILFFGIATIICYLRKIVKLHNDNDKKQDIVNKLLNKKLHKIFDEIKNNNE